MNVKNFKYYTPTLAQSWLLALILAIGGGFFGVIIGMLKDVPQLGFLKWQSVSYILMMVLPFLWISYSSKLSIRNNNTPVKVNMPNFGSINPILFFVLIFVGLLAINVVSDPLTSFIPMPEVIKELFRKSFVDNNIIDIIISVSILAPLCEEMLCRGVILRGLLQHTTPAKAIIWSALIFAVIHFNPWQAIPAFIIGSFFGWVYYRTKSIWAVIFLHCANNTTSIILTKLFPNLDVDMGLADMVSSQSYILMIVASALIFTLIIFVLNKKLPNETKEVISA